MKKIKLITVVYILVTLTVIFINGCKPSQMVSDKMGATLWGENCQRCHNLPPPTMYNDDQWKAIVTHMQVRANITKEEATKILDFLQASN
jgi:hypothetical protein